MQCAQVRSQSSRACLPFTAINSLTARNCSNSSDEGCVGEGIDVEEVDVAEPDWRGAVEPGPAVGF